MRIKTINIKHFRGFEEASFTLDKKMNVILGNNTTGKTSLLHAVEIALGAYLQTFSLLPKEAPYRRNFEKRDRVLKYNEAKNDFILSGNNPLVKVEVVLQSKGKNTGGEFKQENNISWYRELKGNTTIHGKRNAGDLIDIVNKWKEYRISENKDTNIVLPIMLAFGADRIDNNYKQVIKKRKPESKIDKAYKFALLEKVDFKSALDWIYKYNSSTKNIKEVEGTDRAFFNALETAARLQNIAIDKDNRGLWADVKVSNQAKQRVNYEMMSSGFKAMVNIVSEIAYRCIMLNEWLGENAVKQTPGIVLIDEIDLYLHPHWQQHVLRDFNEAFPNIQFIVTTHSPFIVQSVESKNLITLDTQTDNISPSNRGIEEIASVEMGLADMLRSKKYREQKALAEQYFNLVKEGKEGSVDIQEVQEKLRQLEIEASLFHDPAYEAFLLLNKGRL